MPMLVHIMDQPELDHGEGPIGVILAPTRELCIQIHHEAKKFCKAYNLTVRAHPGSGSAAQLRGWGATLTLVVGARLSPAGWLQTVAVYGGAPKMDQFKELRSGIRPEIIVATPGRLIDMIKMKVRSGRKAGLCGNALQPRRAHRSPAV